LAIVQVTPLTVVQDKPLLSVARAPPLDGPFTVTVIILDVAALAARVTAAVVVLELVVNDDEVVVTYPVADPVRV
jgi:hypothetical protein